MLRRLLLSIFIWCFVSGVASAVVVSRLELDHPALGTVGGSSLHTSMDNIYVKIGDNMGSRYFETDALADSASVDFDHNFTTAFSTLRYDLYTRSGGELTEVTDLSNWTIAATPGSLTTQIRVTNNTGGPLDIALVVYHDPINVEDLADVDMTVAPTDGQALIWETSSSKWKALTVAQTQPTYITKSAIYTAVAGDYILTDTSGGVFTITLPITPTVGDTVIFYDSTGSWGTNNLTIARNGEDINNTASNYTLAGSATGAIFVYVSAAQGWRVFLYA